MTALAAIKREIEALTANWRMAGYGQVELGEASDGTWRLFSLDGELLDPCRAYALADVLAFVKAQDRQIQESIARDSGPFGVSGFNGSSTTKSRGRPEDPAVARRRDRLVELAQQSQPATVRQLYYLAETEELVPKAETGYRRVQHDILLLRRLGRIPYDWISDNTRWMRKSRSYRGIDHFLNLTIETYRRDLWATAPVYVEIWCEKDALAGVIMEETDLYDVPLMVARGCSSETYLYEAATAMAAQEKPAFIYHFGDRDPTGCVAAVHIERALRGFAPDAEIHFESVAVTPDQITAWKLPTRPTKREGNRHAKDFIGDSCELDAIPPLQLRELVRGCIERHIDAGRFETMKVAEESEREALAMFARNWRSQP
jgi:hypothetical protein